MKRAFTLAETVVALSILFSVFVIFVALINSALSYNAQVDKRAVAAQAAERKLEEMTDWANQDPGTGFNFDLGAWGGFASAPDSVYPDLTVDTQVSDVNVDSPDSQMETLHAGDEIRLAGSMKRVEVTVRWHPTDLTRRLTVVGYIGAPVRTVRAATPVEVTPVGGVIPPVVANGASVDFQAQAFDNHDNPIPGLVYRWYTKPGNLPNAGNGWVQVIDRAGRQATFTNTIYQEDGGTMPSPTGTCTLQVRAHYHGVDYWGESDVINLP